MQYKSTTPALAAQYGVAATRKEKRVIHDANYLATYMECIKEAAGDLEIDEAVGARTIKWWQAQTPIDAPSYWPNPL